MKHLPRRCGCPQCDRVACKPPVHPRTRRMATRAMRHSSKQSLAVTTRVINHTN